MKAITMITVVIALYISVHAASAEPLISVEPANIEVSEGESFTVNIMVDPGGVEVMGVQYQLHFDNTLLNATGQIEGAFLSYGGASTINIVNRRNNTIGLIEYGEMRKGIDYGVTTSGILATIKFNATKHGVSSLNLRDVVMSDPDTNVGEIPDVSINDGTCTIRSTGTGTPTATQTATTPPPTEMATPTATGAPTPAPTTPVTTATAAETAAADQTSPESDSTASLSATPKQTMECPSDDGISGFTSAFATIGMLIALYVISKGKR